MWSAYGQFNPVLKVIYKLFNGSSILLGNLQSSVGSPKLQESTYEPSFLSPTSTTDSYLSESRLSKQRSYRDGGTGFWTQIPHRKISARSPGAVVIFIQFSTPQEEQLWLLYGEAAALNRSETLNGSSTEIGSRDGQPHVAPASMLWDLAFQGPYPPATRSASSRTRSRHPHSPARYSAVGCTRSIFFSKMIIVVQHRCFWAVSPAFAPASEFTGLSASSDRISSEPLSKPYENAFKRYWGRPGACQIRGK